MTPITRRRFVAAGSGLLLPISAFTTEASVYARRVLEKGPVGYWRFGEKAPGPIADATTNGRNGTISGGVTLGEKGIFNRESDTAAKFDGTSGYIEIPSNAAFSQPTSGNGLTVEVWMRPDALDFSGETGENYVHWLGKGTGSGTTGQMEWTFRFYPYNSSRPNRISAYLFNPSGGLGSGAYVEEVIAEGEWMHLVATFDPGDHTDPNAGVSLYKNGKLIRGPRTNSPGTFYSHPEYMVASAAGSAPLRIGTRDKNSFFTGALDEVAIYPRVLNDDEIADNYRAGQAG